MSGKERELIPGEDFAEIEVEATGDGRRLDHILDQEFPDRSRSFLQRCIRSGLVSRNGRPCRPAEKVSVGDTIKIQWPEDLTRQIVAEDIPLDILHEDEDVIVVNKAPGIVVHPTGNRMTGTLVHALINHDPVSFRGLMDEQLRPGIVHRLDKDTSGVMVVAKNLPAWQALKASFKARDVEKTYLAIVIGEFGVITGRLENLMDRHPVVRTKMAVTEEDGKLAITNYRVLGSTGETSLLQVRIETGRTHQIRVHFSHVRHPVLGDTVYGGKGRGLPYSPGRQMLHAWKLVFPHPQTGVKREYMAPLPQDFLTALKILGLPVIGGGVDYALAMAAPAYREP